ncbi:MAG: PD-(D/E)XK nuclease family protein, partial [Clostridia bacterium]|nr:PD-(D/E)XK nuclease family protein [Clostridia bacterium]
MYDQCPLAFKLQYIDRVPQEQNAYAEYGTHCHSLLERWAKGDLMSFE